jgi:hypothetical protein
MIVTLYHSRANLLQAAHDAGLVLAHEQDLWIERDRAHELFGAATIRKMPSTPFYWMLSPRKPQRVAELAAEMLPSQAPQQPTAEG